MFTSFSRRDIIIGIALAALMVATRGHHLASFLHLPDATLAVFFLAGLYVRPAIAFPILMIEAVGLDYAAITLGGVSSFCVTPAYLLLIPAYGVLWLTGRWYGRRFGASPRHPLSYGASLLMATMVAELLSSGGFYLFSGRFSELSFGEFATRLATYSPAVLASTSLWVGLAAVTHLALAGHARANGPRSKAG